jgi:hypothetical protein
MTDFDHDNLSAIDVIRCVFLARMTERRGHAEAAAAGRPRSMHGLPGRETPPGAAGTPPNEGAATNQPQGARGRYRAELGTSAKDVPGFPPISSHHAPP